MWAAFDRKGIWLFDFLSDSDDYEEVLAEAQAEDEMVAKVVRI